VHCSPAKTNSIMVGPTRSRESSINVTFAKAIDLRRTLGFNNNSSGTPRYPTNKATIMSQDAYFEREREREREDQP
jgi:hypothetical protein